MSLDIEPIKIRTSQELPFHRVVPRLLKDPVTELAKMGCENDGRIVRLNVGPFRPYLVSHPDDVQKVIKTDWENFVRAGMFWRPVWRVTGRGIVGEGLDWETSRRILQPLFTTRYIASLGRQMADVIAAGVAELDAPARAGQPVDSALHMNRIVNRVIIQVLFGGRIPAELGERLAPEFTTCASSIAFRLLLPTVPYSVRIPGDRAFLRALKKIDDIIYPLIDAATRESSVEGDDVLSHVLRARTADGLGDDLRRQLRDDVVSIYGTASETTAMSLTWLWSVLHDHPQVLARLRAEVEEVVGTGPVEPEHIPRLTYLHMVLQELLRVYPAAWLVPRQVKQDTELGGVRIRSGSQLLISPYTTHRLEEFWERPLDFDPGRWDPDKAERRHRYAYFPFGGGPHVCLGQHLFYMEAPLVIANILSRYHTEVANPQPLTPAPGASVRPKEQILLTLRPIHQTR